MKILYIGGEALPFVSTGGLGDVLGSLPAAVAKADPDSDVRCDPPALQDRARMAGKDDAVRRI